MLPPASEKPKRRTTPYEYFMQACRQELKDQNPQGAVDYHRFLRDCEQRWHALGNEEKECFKKMARADGRRYRRQMRRYDPTWAAKRDPKAPKRPKSAYILFCQEYRPQICFDNPGMAITQIAKELGQMWRQLSAWEKRPFQDRADQLKEEYIQKKAEYEAKKRRSVGSTAEEKDQKNLEEDHVSKKDKMEGDNDQTNDDKEQDEEDNEDEEGEEGKASDSTYSSSAGDYEDSDKDSEYED